MRLEVAVVAMLAVSAPAVQGADPAPQDAPASQATQLDLTAPFHARSPWRLVVTAGAPVKDYGDNDAPGPLTLCLRKGPDAPCVSEPVTPPAQAATSGDPPLWEPHYLLAAKLVHPLGAEAAPLLLIVTGSLNSGNGDQVVATQLVAYDRFSDAFRRIYAKSTGHNNNQEVRFVSEGPLRGSVITAEPQEHAPYGYWIAVSQPSADGSYRETLRYASATRYNDGNALAVIDSEMPNTQRRLGVWKAGDPLPAPRLTPKGKPCLHPKLKRDELWCD